MEVEPPEPELGVTPADRDLIAGLAKRDVVVTSAQLKRWRSAHLIPTPVRRSAGRGPGRRSLCYPEGTVERAASVARVMGWKPRIRITEASLWLFLMGEAIELSQVRLDFEREHDAFLRKLPTRADEDAIDAFAERMVDRFSRHPLGKAVVHVAQLGAVRRASDAGKAAYATAYQMLGGRPSRRGMRVIARAFGIEDPELQDEIIEHVRPVRIYRMSRLLVETSDEELTEARDNCLRAIALVAALAPAELTDPIRSHPHRLRKQFKFDGHTAMIGVIQMARMKRAYPNLSDRLLEVLDETRSTSLD